MQIPSVDINHRILILCPVYEHLPAVKLCLGSIMNVLHHRQDVTCMLLDSHSSTSIKQYLDSLSHPKLYVHTFDTNIGKPNGINLWISQHLSSLCIPRILVSLDSDITFSITSFDRLIAATEAIENIGFLSMRYSNNRCNPERNLWLPAQLFKGKDNQAYSIKRPVLCNVAGGLIAIPATVLEKDLAFELYPEATGKVRYPDDAKLYDKLKRKRRIMGYLNDTEATHWRSADIVEYGHST